MRRGALVAFLVVAGACGGAGSRPSAVGSESAVGDSVGGRRSAHSTAVVSRGSTDSGRGSWVVGRDSVPAGPFLLGRRPSKAELKAWNISVNPAGSNLPAGRGTFASGEKVFAAKCAMCHGAQGEGMPPTYPKLVQADPKDFSFDTDYKIPHTVGNYWPYATTLYDYINRAMPLTEPGSLSPDEVYGVVAYLLAANGVIAKDAVIDARTLPKVTMPARDRFENDDRSGGAEFR